MSLQLSSVTKVFGSQKAVNNVSFTVRTGEIVGFLGPNGAGKSTTMKMITGFLSPTEGSIRVNDLEVAEHSLQVKASLGYLPEHNPLYADMYVKEYLRFMGSLYGIRGQQLSKRVADMVELCGLGVEQHKKIETLSKGYRQRVGLAQALLHDPSVLILDEPTSGLDPNQILEIRNVIKEVSRNKTVLFSTHILQEVEAMCDRVLVIAKGILVADDQLARLRARKASVVRVRVEFGQPVDLTELRSAPNISYISEAGAGVYIIESDSSTDIRPVLFRFAADHQLSLVGLRQEEDSLETMFHSLTTSTAHA